MTPRSITRRCSSTRENRESGSSCVRGSSHAIALTSATCSGGKTARSTRPRVILKPIQPFSTEPLSSPGDAIDGAVQPRGDVDVLHPVGRVEDHPRPLHHPERQRDRDRPPLKLNPLGFAELNRHRAGPGRVHSSALRRYPFTHTPQNLRTCLLAGVARRQRGGSGRWIGLKKDRPRLSGRRVGRLHWCSRGCRHHSRGCGCPDPRWCATACDPW